MKEILTINFTSKVVPVKPINDQFTLCKCYIMALGKNGNGTIFGKDAVDDALPSLYNIPVVGRIYVDKDGSLRMGGHDVAIEQDDDGNLRLTSITIPYGTVPVQDNAHYEEVEENGVKQTYLVADIILWTGRYPELLEAKYNEEIFFAQSMEILPSETKKVSDGLDVKKFQFSALCLLGKSDDKAKNVVPCFKSARVEPYVFTGGKTWTELFAEFREQLTKSYSAGDAVKGGTMNTETIKKILLEFGLAEDTALSFEVAEGMSEEDLRAKIQEVYFSSDNTSASDEGDGATAGEPQAEEPQATEPQAEPAPEGEVTTEESAGTDGEAQADYSATDETVQFSLELTYEEKHKALCGALSAFEVSTRTSYVWYCLLDFDDTYVYAHCHIGGVDTAESSDTIRIPYVFTEDKPVLDMASSEKVRQVWLTKEDEDKLEADRAQLAELAQYKADRIEDDKRKAYSAVLAEFQDLGEIEEYKTVVKDAMTFASVDALTEKLYAIRGKHAANKQTKKPLDAIHFPVGFASKVDKKTEEDEFMARYLPKK